MEVSGELNGTYLGWLQPTWRTTPEKPFLEMTCHAGMWRKCVPNRTHPDSSVNFGVGLVQLGVTCCSLQAEAVGGCVLWAMPLACTRRCPHAHSDHPAGLLGAGLQGFPGVTQTTSSPSDLPLLSPPPKRLETSLARRPQLRKQLLCFNSRGI